jgi:hypothetical protein
MATLLLVMTIARQAQLQTLLPLRTRHGLFLLTNKQSREKQIAQRKECFLFFFYQEKKEQFHFIFPFFLDTFKMCTYHKKDTKEATKKIIN